MSAVPVRPGMRTNTLRWAWIATFVAVLSLAANGVQAAATPPRTVFFQVVNTTVPKVIGFTDMAASSLAATPSQTISTDSTGAAVIWNQAAGALEASAPALTALGVPDVSTVVQEYDVVADEIPYAGSPIDAANFAKARRFVALAAELLPHSNHLMYTTAELAPLSQAFAALAYRGSFVLP